jgi:hypothetical protein
MDMLKLDYRDVLAEVEGSDASLLLGNGFSIGFSKSFRYDDIFNKAEESLGAVATEVFTERLRSSNFEAAIRLYDDAQWLVAAHGGDVPGSVGEERELIKRAFLSALDAVHPAGAGALTAKHKESAHQFLRSYSQVFTLNYDLLVYWVLMHANPRIFGDGFGETIVTDARGEPDVVLGFCSNFPATRPVWYLHGALHFFREPGYLSKCVASEEQTVIENVRAQMAEDRYPLIVLEGRHDQKHTAIDADSYLAKAREALETAEGPLVTYGVSFSDHDLHIVEAIVGNEALTPVFAGVHDEAKLPEVKDTIDRFATSDDGTRFRYFDSKSVDPWNMEVNEDSDQDDRW